MEDEMYSQICYKKRVRDDKLIFIGKAILHEDKDKWDIEYYLPVVDKSDKGSLTSDCYYAGFLDSKGMIIDIDDSYYDNQIYLKPPVIVGDLPYVTGILGYGDILYYDSFIDNDMVKLLIEINL